VQLVDKIVLEQRVHELAAAIGHDILARLRFDLAHCIYHLTADNRGVAPGRLLQRLRHHVFLWRVHHVTEEIAGWHWLECRRVSDISASAEEEGAGILHRLGERLADVAAPVRNRPAAVLEPPVSTSLLPASRLDPAIELRKF